MPKVNLSGMSFEALVDLREQVDETLLKRRADIEKQLARMGAARLAAHELVEAHWRERKSRRNIEAHQAKLGQAVAQSLVGLLLR
jgi:hypothetical protein